jgi:3-deoxy-D-manno-octulosonic-acid transferase
MLRIYSTLIYLLIPFIFLRLLWRGFKAPDYWRRWSERIAYYQQTHAQNVIWFHAVSVGEAEAVFPLVRLMLQRHPEYQVLITTTTPTGSARVKAVMEDAVEHVYLPYDFAPAIARFLAHFKPRMAVIMETEIWPNLFVQCANNSIPLFIVNARLSEKSARGYHKLPALVNLSLSRISRIAAQTEADAARFISIGADKSKVLVTGNIKFDLELPEQILQQGRQIRLANFPGRLVWVIASTHKGEDEIFLQAYRQLKQQFPELLLVLVPRHPERFAEVKGLCIREGFKVIMRTEEKACVLDTDIYIGDTMGELKTLYAAADLAFVAGSMVPVGGHNVLEPIALDVAVMFGPYMHNFKEIERGLLAEHGGIQCQDQDMLIQKAAALLGSSEKRLALAARGKAFVLKNQGALQRVFEILNANLDNK